ncbi:hypothetical protein VFPBJ_05884 [Purpureocillium lilacinum]|uniref:Uncharacterized protein n=1 Tax=Purpureocillium lilacinum TaxID=33203 RepID=A0A179GT34_PURLI|nr:hypothetical protein VFPBJ_05884 [Purpureocillium lilacinum]
MVFLKLQITWVTSRCALCSFLQRCSVPRGNGETQRRYYIQGAHFVVRVILKSCSNPPTSSSGPETRQPFNSATRRFDGCRYRRRRGMTPRRPSFMVGRRQRRAGSKGGREKGSSAGQAVIQAPRCAARAASRAVYAPGCMMPGIVVGCAYAFVVEPRGLSGSRCAAGRTKRCRNKAGRAGGGKASSGRGQRSAGRGFQANNGFVVFVSHTGTGGTMWFVCFFCFLGSESWSHGPQSGQRDEEIHTTSSHTQTHTSKAAIPGGYIVYCYIQTRHAFGYETMRRGNGGLVGATTTTITVLLLRTEYYARRILAMTATMGVRGAQGREETRRRGARALSVQCTYRRAWRARGGFLRFRCQREYTYAVCTYVRSGEWWW